MSISIQQANPGLSYIELREEINAAVKKVLDSGWYILGEEVANFEKEFSSFLGVKDTVGVGSGTDALHLALRVLGIEQDDIVLTVSHTAVATVAAVELAGAIPVMLDIDPVTYTIDTNLLEQTVSALRHKYGSRLKAIVPVHLYGHPADMIEIMRIANKNELYVIEDCAQAHGAKIDKKRLGSYGHLSAFSFYPTKNLSAFGDGGALVINDNSLYAGMARELREYGWRDRYISAVPGMNTRLDEIHAATLRVKLRYLDAHNNNRRNIAGIYDSLLADTGVHLPKTRKGVSHVYHQYVVRSSRRKSLQKYLREHRISTAVHYPVPVHLQPAYKKRLEAGVGGLPVTESICGEILSLPMHQHISENMAQRVCEQIALWSGRT